MNERLEYIDGQSLWKQEKKHPWEVISQAIDMPSWIGAKIMKEVVTHMPSYIPQEVVSEIVRTHPAPLITASLLPDQRIFFMTKEPDVPSAVPEQDKRAWEIGMEMLNEIGTEYVARDVAKNISRVNAYESYFELLLHVMSERDRQHFLHHTAIAMLSHDLTDIEKFVGNIDSFAVRLGRIGMKEDYVKKDLHGSLMHRQFHCMARGDQAAYTYDFPGVINIFLGSKLRGPLFVNAAIALEAFVPNKILGAAGLVLGLTAGLSDAFFDVYVMPHIVIHETVHYLSHDIGQFGFLPLKRVT